MSSGNYLVDRMDREDAGGRLPGVVMLCPECMLEFCRCEEYKKEREEELKAYQETEEDMKTKEERAARKAEKVVELTGIFRREYEMMRAHGMKMQTAGFKAADALSFEIRKACRAVPQDKSFLIDCKLEVMAKIEALVVEVEKGVAL